MLTPAQCDHIDVVLVSPRNPLNIGAAARAMANFGFKRLSIVAPFAVNWMEAKSAVGAPDLLREARVYETLAEAVAHCTFVLGTGSLDRRRPVQAILPLPEAAAKIRTALNPSGTSLTPDGVLALPGSRFVKGHDFSRADQANETNGALAPETNSAPIALPGAPGPDSGTWDSSDPHKQPTAHVALLFGSEKHGLTSEDLSWCHALAVIETCDDQPSMNLGQAVAVCLYELSREPNNANAPVATSQPNPDPPYPDSAQLDRLAALIEQTMEAANYSTRGLRSANGEALRVLLRRLMPNEADLRRMMGLFRRILWQLNRPSGKL